MSEQWTYTEVAQHIGVKVGTARRMRGKGSIPVPDGRLGATPWWSPDTIRAWAAARPGRGVGGGRPRRSNEKRVTAPIPAATASPTAVGGPRAPTP